MLSLLLALTALVPPRPLLAGLSPQYQTEGSGCPYEDSGHYFDYIDVEDDEDYVSEEEGSTPQAVRRGPPVFTDSVEENLIVEKSEFDVKEKKTKRRDEDEGKPESPTPSVIGKIIPETLVIKNQTHAKLNGRLTITNSQVEQQSAPELFFEEENERSEENEDAFEIGIESKTCKMSSSLATAVFCIFIMFL